MLCGGLQHAVANMQEYIENVSYKNLVACGCRQGGDRIFFDWRGKYSNIMWTLIDNSRLRCSCEGRRCFRSLLGKQVGEARE